MGRIQLGILDEARAIVKDHDEIQEMREIYRFLYDELRKSEVAIGNHTLMIFVRIGPEDKDKIFLHKVDDMHFKEKIVHAVSERLDELYHLQQKAIQQIHELGNTKKEISE